MLKRSSARAVQAARLRPACVPDLSVCVREVGQADLERLLVSEEERRKVFGGTSGVMFVFLDAEEIEEQAKTKDTPCATSCVDHYRAGADQPDA